MTRPSARRLASAILAFVVLQPTAASGAVDPCCDEARYPSFLRLEQTETGMRALLFGKPGDPVDWPERRPTLKYSKTEGWQRDEPFDLHTPFPSNAAQPPDIPLAPIQLSRQAAEALRPELKDADEIEHELGSSTEYRGVQWFGISFYAGEGSDGVGGIVRYDPKTREVIVRRPAAIRDSSIDYIAHDGKWLWLATSQHGEYGGPPTHGLARYDWNADRVETYEGSDAGPCGFNIRGLVLDPESLWVATDLGLSRWDRGAQSWQHFIPDMGAESLMRPTTCEALYTSLFQSLPNTPVDGEWDCCRSELFDWLGRFRPRFLAAHVKDIPPANWGCDELRMLARQSPDYASLKSNVLDRYPESGRDLFCAMMGFAKKKSREPEWRDVLLTWLDSPNFLNEYVVRLLAEFKGDTKVGEAFARRLQTTIVLNPWQEAELLPTFLGDKSVPVLIEALDRFGPEREQVATSIIKGLMQATRTSIDADGKQTSIPAGSDPDCSTFGCPRRDDVVARVADQWRAWWKEHKQDYTMDR